MSLKFYLLPKHYVFTKYLEYNKHSLLFFNESIHNTSIIEKSKAIKLNVEYRFECRCIKLLTKTKLTDIGISSKVSSILASNNIPCNIVSGFENDYFFVPFKEGLKALKILNSLS